MNIYEILNDIIPDRFDELEPRLFTDDNRNMLIGEDQLRFDILKNISSMYTDVNNRGVEYKPMFVNKDGSTSFSVTDITEEQFQILRSMCFEKMPLILRARVADILWVYRRDYKCSVIAANTYWELFNLNYLDGENSEILEMIMRAMCIATQTKQSELMDNILVWKDEFINGIAEKMDVFIVLRIIELFLDQNNCDVQPFLGLLDSIISKNKEVIFIVEQAFEVKTCCFNKLKKKQEAVENNLLLADYYIKHAETLIGQDGSNLMRAVMFLQKSIEIYRNNGATELAKEIQRKMVQVQKGIPLSMDCFSATIDITDIQNSINKNMKDLSFEECIIRLTQLFVFEKQDDIRKTVINSSKNSLNYMFKQSEINELGQTKLILPSFDANNPEVVELYMFWHLRKKQRDTGNILIKNILSYINNHFTVDPSMVEFLVKGNPIVPDGRERIIQNGVSMFLKGDYYEAIHILAPQTENIFRYIAREVGGMTVTLENDGTSMEKTLKSIFTLPELLDSYDNDILFIFRGLLNEHAGANIRNEVAHGILSEPASFSGECLYFGAAVIKLLSLTSGRCREIFKNSERLKHIDISNKGV